MLLKAFQHCHVNNGILEQDTFPKSLDGSAYRISRVEENGPELDARVKLDARFDFFEFFFF